MSSCKVTEPIVVSHDNLKFKSINDSILKFSLDTHVLNPSKHSYQLKELLFDINYQDKKIANGLLSTPTDLNSKDTISLPLECSINLSTLHKVYQNIFQQETAEIQFTGKAHAVHPLKKIRKDFEFKISFNPQDFISNNLMSNDLTINQIGTKKANLFSLKNLFNTKFYLIAQIKNEHFIDFKINKMQLQLKSEKTNRIMMRGMLDDVIDIPRLQTTQIPINVESNNFNLLQDFGSYFLSAGDNTYSGTGNITFSIMDYDFTIPFYQEFYLNKGLLRHNKTKDSYSEIKENH